MTNDQQLRLTRVLASLSELYPDWRVGQLVANISTWARGPIAEAVWDVEDEEFLAAAEAHLARRLADSSSQGFGSKPISRVG
ncbi:MAG TPA: hypothetical protein VIM11_06085 [Tepidisphaeraceae bacterium]|jgi:hypothetical protein